MLHYIVARNKYGFTVENRWCWVVYKRSTTKGPYWNRWHLQQRVRIVN